MTAWLEVLVAGGVIALMMGLRILLRERLPRQDGTPGAACGAGACRAACARAEREAAQRPRPMSTT